MGCYVSADFDAKDASFESKADAADLATTALGARAELGVFRVNK